MQTISKLAEKFALSRATLLYYEREGLLEPASRAANGYRWYGEAEIARLKQIVAYRSYGVPVNDIREMLARDDDQAHEKILRKRFTRLETEIQDLRRQQQALVAILEQSNTPSQHSMNKERWTGIMQAAGMDDEDMKNWHREFEAREPKGHQEFLESLNIKTAEIRRIRNWSKANA